MLFFYSKNINLKKNKRMKTNIEFTKKLFYSTPSIVKIILDNEISLALQSYEPPGDPGSDTPPGDPGAMNSPVYFNNNPFNTINA